MKEFATVLYGSQNYGLDGPDSDRDYKVLLCPDFDDFYQYRKVEKGDVPAGLDLAHYSPMSIMQFHRQLMKGNPNCLEMLFSAEWHIRNQSLRHYIEKARTLYDMGYLAMVWDAFYPAVMGLILNSVDRNGVNEKTISRACFFFDMMIYVRTDCYRMNLLTWRGGKVFQNHARLIRFGGIGQEKLSKLNEFVRRRFSEIKADTSKAASEYCQWNSEAVQHMQRIAQELDREMRNIVARSIREELAAG